MALLLILAAAPLWKGKPRNTQRETIWASAAAVSLTALIIAALFLLPLSGLGAVNEPLPGRWILYARVVRPGLGPFLRMYRRTRDPLLWWLALSVGVNVVAQCVLGFSQQVGDLYYDAAHVYKMLGYGIPILGFALSQISDIVEVRRISAVLAEEKEALGGVERTLAQQTQDLSELVQLLDLANVMVFGLDYRITRWNTGCRRMYGYSASEAIGRISHELLRTQFPQPLEVIRQTLMDTGRWDGELVHTTADGPKSPCSANGYCSRDARENRPRFWK